MPAQQTVTGLGGGRCPAHRGGKVTEVALLLPADNADALVAEAEDAGLAAGVLIRRILAGYLSGGKGKPFRGGRRVREAARWDVHIGAIAHELGNALHPLVLGAEVIRLAGPESPAGRAACGRLSQQTAYLQQVLQRMLDFHRSGTGRLALVSIPIDVGALSAGAAEVVDAIVRERGHRLTLRVAPDAGPLRGDPVRLAQVLVNLLTNAARYTDPGGEISLTADREGPAVVIRVRDTGVGIPAHHLPRMFDGSGPADLSRGGLGIGLRLVRRLVELHGGTVGVTSEGAGAGSEFVVTLPAGE